MSPLILPLDSLSNKHREARRAAEQGLGWADLVVLFGLTEDQARNEVFGAELRRINREMEDDDPRL